jgi:hypothetical protein
MTIFESGVELGYENRRTDMVKCYVHANTCRFVLKQAIPGDALFRTNLSTVVCVLKEARCLNKMRNKYLLAKYLIELDKTRI